MAAPEADDFCTICREAYNLPCQANCSHWFCGKCHGCNIGYHRSLITGNCILNWWHRGPPSQPCKCPICRRSITLLIPPNDVPNQQEAITVLRDIENYNRMFGGEPLTLTQRLWDLPFFIRRLFRELLDPQRALPVVFKARMMFAVLMSAIYVLSPVDILPEGVLGFVGFLDDLLVVLIVVLHLAAIYRQVLLFRHGGQ